jgi:hypothetical protein
MSKQLSPYKLMADDTVVAAIANLERICSQPRFEYLPAAVRQSCLDELDRARAELERRRT